MIDAKKPPIQGKRALKVWEPLITALVVVAIGYVLVSGLFFLAINFASDSALKDDVYAPEQPVVLSEAKESILSELSRAELHSGIALPRNTYLLEYTESEGLNSRSWTIFSNHPLSREQLGSPEAAGSPYSWQQVVDHAGNAYVPQATGVYHRSWTNGTMFYDLTFGRTAQGDYAYFSASEPR